MKIPQILTLIQSGFCTFTIDLIVKCLYTVKAELKSSA